MKTNVLLTGLLAATSSCFSQVLENCSITTGTVLASSFISDAEGWLANNNGKLFHTSNGGESWDSIPVGQSFSKLHFSDSLNGYAITSLEVFKTANGGKTWSSVAFPWNAHLEAIWFQDESTGFIGSYEKIYETTDGGITWSATELEGVSILDFYFTGSTVGMAAGYDYELNHCIWRTTDGGETWNPVFNEENYYMNAVYFVNDSFGWAAGYYDRAGLKEPAILNSTDGGISWEKNYRYENISSSGETLTDIRFRNELEGYALSVHNCDLYTTDGGTTWILVNDTEELSSSPIFGLYRSLDGSSNLYLAGKSGSFAVWK